MVSLHFGADSLTVATWSECCITRMTSHRPRTWHPPQSHYEADNGLTSLISLACGLSSRFVTWVVWSSDCTALLKGLWFSLPWGVKYPFILLGREKQFELGALLKDTWKYYYRYFHSREREYCHDRESNLEPADSKSKTLPLDYPLLPKKTS